MLWLDNHVQLASWYNCDDRVTHLSDHHTLSLYTAQGEDTWYRSPQGWQNGGGPNKLCLMPAHSSSTWDIRSHLYFVHLYCSERHLTDLAERIWDRSVHSLTPEPQVFANDPQITQLYRQFLLNCDWSESANQLLLTTTSSLLLTWLVQRYSSVNWRLPAIKGGLSPTVLTRCYDYIEAHLGDKLSLADLAGVAALSQYHFARMFRTSTGMAPHQYLTRRRMARAEQWVVETDLSFTTIASDCGFSSASHFSRCFRAFYGLTPSQRRGAG